MNRRVTEAASAGFFQAVRCVLCTLCCAIWWSSGHAQSAVSAAFAPDGYPTEIAESLFSRRQAEERAASEASIKSAFAFVADNLRWEAGQKLIVAVHGGTFEVWRDIAKIAGQWSTVANVTFDFGLDPKKRTVRTWNPNDPAAVSAQVKIRLDIGDRKLRYTAVGQEAFQKEFQAGSMVLGGLANSHPLWTPEDRADILHEFGHVLGFLHEQQRPECQKELRMERGPKGEPSVVDLYIEHTTWKIDKIKANLALGASYTGTFTGQPDRRSIFLYPTEDWLLPATLHGVAGPCYAKRKNLIFSKDDVARARADYPFFVDNSNANLRISNFQVLKNVVSTATNQLSAAPLLERLENVERALRPMVYIQVSSESQREAGKALQRSLRDGGFLAPGIENVAGKARIPKRPEVRFFRRSDARQAQSVAEIVSRELGGSFISTHFIALEREQKPPIEVWLQQAN
jgi:hypothetical protein